MASFDNQYICVAYLSRTRIPPRGPVMTNSSDIKEVAASTRGSQRYTFKFVPEGSDIALSKEIRSLDSLDDPELIAWGNNFRQLASLCNWSDVTAVATLKAVVSAEILQIFYTKKTLDTCLAALLAAKFPSRDCYRYFTGPEALE